MKKFFPQLSMLLAALLVLPLFFSSCSDEDPVDPPPPPPNQDGVYVFGTNTIAALATDEGARMALAKLDFKQGKKVESLDGVYGKLMYIGANSTIQFMEVKNKVATTFGALNGGTVAMGTEVGNVPINDEVVHGELLKDGAAIKVAEEGLYYTYLNMLDGTFVVVPVKPQIIGDATELQWSAGTPLNTKSVDKTKAVFEVQNLEMYAEHGYRYRINDGWHVYQDAEIVTLSSIGVAELWGDAWAKEQNDLGFFIENAPHKQTGIFTVTLTYDAATDTWSETKTKTGEFVADMTDYEMSIFGNAYVTAPGDTANWVSEEDGYGLHTPQKSGHVYTWNWQDVDLIEGREFIFLQDGKWGGILIDYTGATNGGAAIDNGNIVDATTLGGQYHNYFVVNAGSYDVTLVIDAAANTKTVTFTKN
jgi:hypothetical protein